MRDVLSWGGETQALIDLPTLRKVIAINALGVAPTGGTAEFYRTRGMNAPPEHGPLAAVTPGTPGGFMTVRAEYGTRSLAEVVAAAIQMADGNPIEAQAANSIENNQARLKQGKYARDIMLPPLGETREAPAAGELCLQRDLAATPRRLVEAERQALRASQPRKAAIHVANDRSFGVTSPRKSCAACARRADCSRATTWPTGA